MTAIPKDRVYCHLWWTPFTRISRLPWVWQQQFDSKRLYQMYGIIFQNAAFFCVPLSQRTEFHTRKNNKYFSTYSSLLPVSILVGAEFFKYRIIFIIYLLNPVLCNAAYCVTSWTKAFGSVLVTRRDTTAWFKVASSAGKPKCSGWHDLQTYSSQYFSTESVSSNSCLDTV